MGSSTSSSSISRRRRLPVTSLTSELRLSTSLPPPFPNSWFIYLSSTRSSGEARSVTHISVVRSDRDRFWFAGWFQRGRSDGGACRAAKWRGIIGLRLRTRRGRNEVVYTASQEDLESKQHGVNWLAPLVRRGRLVVFLLPWQRPIGSYEVEKVFPCFRMVLFHKKIYSGAVK